ncbi:lipoprotein signal peptidase [Alistipes sp. OttesenSCG-928-B03]|nr:lipoprotein signal peptidase [Alistipes sp. OttesenSCG-928-B03]
MTRKKITIILVALIIIDQVVKILIKTNMALGESITVFPDWFRIYFIENPGAAFGMQLGGDYGKLILSLFRIGAVAVLIWYLNRLLKRKAPTGVIVGFGLILVGALGNIIDSAFYGMIFSESTTSTVATMFPEGGGYAGFLHGKVVDMLYFPLFTINNMPDWLSWLGGSDGSFTFFSPVFNIADSYITIGVIYLLLFQWKYFK